MKRIIVISLSLSLFFIIGLGHRFPVLTHNVFPFAAGSLELHAEEIQLAQEEPPSWEDLSPETKKFLRELGEEVEKMEKNAVRNVSEWLQLVDEGKYKDACEQVSYYMFAAAMGQHHKINPCIDRLKRTRENYGPIIKRKLLSTMFIPDERLYEVSFSTVSEKKTVKEIITTRTWEVDEYYIQEDGGEPKLVIPYYP